MSVINRFGDNQIENMASVNITLNFDDKFKEYTPTEVSSLNESDADGMSANNNGILTPISTTVVEDSPVAVEDAKSDANEYVPSATAPPMISATAPPMISQVVKDGVEKETKTAVKRKTKAVEDSKKGAKSGVSKRKNKKINPTNYEILNCEFCKKLYKNKKCMMRHMQTCNKSKESLKRRRVENNNSEERTKNKQPKISESIGKTKELEVEKEEAVPNHTKSEVRKTKETSSNDNNKIDNTDVVVVATTSSFDDYNKLEDNTFQCKKCNKKYKKLSFIKRHSLACVPKSRKDSNQYGDVKFLKNSLFEECLKKYNANRSIFDFTSETYNTGTKLNVNSSYLLAVDDCGSNQQSELSAFQTKINKEIAELKKMSSRDNISKVDVAEYKQKMKFLKCYKKLRSMELGKIYTNKKKGSILKFLNDIKNVGVSDFKQSVANSLKCFNISESEYNPYLYEISTGCLNWLSAILMQEMMGNLDKRTKSMSFMCLNSKRMIELSLKKMVDHYMIPQPLKNVHVPKKFYKTILANIYNLFGVENTSDFLDMALSSFKDSKFHGLIARVFLTIKPTKELLKLLEDLYIEYISLCVLTITFLKTKQNMDFKNALVRCARNSWWFPFQQYLYSKGEFCFKFERIHQSTKHYGYAYSNEDRDKMAPVSKTMPSKELWNETKSEVNDNVEDNNYSDSDSVSNSEDDEKNKKIHETNNNDDDDEEKEDLNSNKNSRSVDGSGSSSIVSDAREESIYKNYK